MDDIYIYIYIYSMDICEISKTSFMPQLIPEI